MTRILLAILFETKFKLFQKETMTSFWGEIKCIKKNQLCLNVTTFTHMTLLFTHYRLVRKLKLFLKDENYFVILQPK